MSARRARIKAVTSFPARRKDVADKGQIPDQEQKETVEKLGAEPREESMDVESTPVDVKSKETMEGLINTVPFDFSDDDFITSLFNTPDSATEGNVMDGIVPLEPVSSPPNPDDLLNEIISENAEVSFDPIVPLPTSSTVRPKIRPVPRLAALKRSTLQASVSVAEDSRRALLSDYGLSTSAAPQQGHFAHDSPHSAIHSLPNRGVKRTRDGAVSSNVSQATPQPGPSTSSPVKDKHLSESHRVDMPRRVTYTTSMRHLRETGRTEPLRMSDLIFMNPKSDPMVRDQAKLAYERELIAARRAAIAQEKHKEDQTKMKINVAPVPQIKLGPNGDIILDEQSLVIQQSEKRKVPSTVVNASTSCGYRYTKRTAPWKETETLRFYRALSSMGTDFMLMDNLFPGRTRKDLKIKYKNEERANTAQVEKALRSMTKWDATGLEKQFRAERKEEEKAEEELRLRAIELKQQKKEARKRVPKSLAAKSLGESALPAIKIIKPIIVRSKAKTQKSNGMTTNTDTKSNGKAPYKPPKILAKLPTNLTEGTLVVRRNTNPSCPPEKKLESLVVRAGGVLQPINLPPLFLKNIVTFLDTGVMPGDRSGGSAGSWRSA